MQQNSCQNSHCHDHSKTDFLLWGSFGIIVLSAIYLIFLGNFGPLWLNQLSQDIVDLLIKMSWGLILSIFFVGLMDFIPRNKFHQILGRGQGLNPILRATLAGVVLDLCNHGILLVGMKLYERGLSLGQVVAFLVASPWNSLSMTLILLSLVGVKLTLIFILFSCIIAIATGLIFEGLVTRGVLSENPNKTEATSEKSPWFDFRGWSARKIMVHWVKTGLVESKSILRWIFFGIILTATVRLLLSPENFQYFFGPDTLGVLMTIGVATVLEVCSEGSAPLAADIVNRAGAPGNGFSFLMAGVSTDYTEIVAIKETTKSWKSALFLPLITLPQIIVLGIILNHWG